jgi:hypothetical protein
VMWDSKHHPVPIVASYSLNDVHRSAIHAHPRTAPNQILQRYLTNHKLSNPSEFSGMYLIPQAVVDMPCQTFGYDTKS